MPTLPFTTRQFFEVFGAYNEAIWPMQWVLHGLGLFAVAAVFLPIRARMQIIAAVLAFLWAWMAVAYHFLHFAAINPMAVLFALFFVIEAALLLGLGVWQEALRFGWNGAARGALAFALVAYALVVYPLLNPLLGHEYPQAPTFGAPCPTVIFTIGMLFFTTALPRVLLTIPILWSAVGGSAAFLLGVPQDLGLPVAGLLALGLAIMRPTARRHSSNAR